jgi:general secretion pathway protein K
MSNRPTGFALAAILWLLAGLSIVVSLVNDAALSSADRVKQMRERADFINSVYSARAHIIYFVALAQPQFAGYMRGESLLRADDVPYRLDTKSVVRIQDTGGLISLNRLNRQTLALFMQSCGVTLDKIPYLIDALEDYIDEDNLQRINGAEADTYKKYDEPAPRNGFLLSTAEIWQVHGWKTWKKTLEASGCYRGLTTLGGMGLQGAMINMATAPLAVLLASGLDEASAIDVIAARDSNQAVADRVANLAGTAGGAGMFGSVGNFVQPELRITHEHINMPLTMQYTLKLNLNSDDKPWSISQPIISAKSYTPTFASIRAIEWPLDSSKSAPTINANPVLPF